MTGQNSVLPEDDFWHEPTSDDPHWTETSYWGFYVPERRLSGTIYNMWRKNLGLVVSRIWIWDNSGDSPTDALYTKMCEHIEIPQGADPTNFELPTGLSCNRVAPLQEHHFRYADGPEVSFDLTARALRPPVAAFHTTEPGTGHFDQHIHVTGNLRVWGEDLNVDCMSMRDRTWSNRSDYMGDHLRLLNGYMHGAESESNCWLVMAVGSPDSTAEQGIPEGTGALVRDGTKATIVGGSRKVTNRRDGRPDAIELEFVDELGRNLQVHGEALNHLGTMLNPSIFNWWSLYRWTDAKGTVSYGESQETWIPLSALQRDRYVERASR